MTIAQTLEPHWFDDNLAIAGALSRDDMARFVGQGCRMLIDLRDGSEAGGAGLLSTEERAYAGRLGIEYHSIPLSPGGRCEDSIAAVRQLLSRSVGRTVLHCSDGARAAAMALIHLGCDQGAMLGECYARAEALRARDCNVEEFMDLWVEYILYHPDDRATAVTRRRQQAGACPAANPRRPISWSEPGH